MIAATLYGGLGNQMFIYAVVRATALRNCTTMAFNLNQGFKDDKLFHRSLELEHFHLQLPEDSISTFDVPLGKYIRYASRIIGFNLLKPSMRFLEERSVKLDDILKAKNAFIEGYFANDVYFADHADIIRRDFTVKKQFITKNIKEELEQIKKYGRPIVMIGVRRYQECKTKSNIPQGGATETPSYFKNAMRHVSESVKNPIFWVFSQQQEWFKDNVDDGTYDVVYAKTKEGEHSAIEDFYLMEQCDHYIITRSTYYWWAAWLSSNKGKIVICPRSYKSLSEGWMFV